MAHRGWKRDGFTPAKKARAIEALGKYGNVTDAARVAGVSDTTFYRHLNKDAGFARLCETARAKASQPLETLAWQRATEGAPETIIRGGEVVQIKVKPSDSLMRLLLQASNPKKYGRLARGGATRRQIERKLRKTIEAEVRAEIEAKRGGPPRDVKVLIAEISARLAEIKAEEAEKARRRPEEGEGSAAA
jgi:AcrR family transcriptional regulator